MVMCEYKERKTIISFGNKIYVHNVFILILTEPSP